MNTNFIWTDDKIAEMRQQYSEHKPDYQTLFSNATCLHIFSLFYYIYESDIESQVLALVSVIGEEQILD